MEKTGGTGTSNLSTRVDNTGTIVADAGLLNVNGAVTGSGVWDIGATATVEFRYAVAAGGTIAFAGAGGVLELDDAAAFKASVGGFAAGEALNLRSIPLGSHLTLGYSGTTTSGTLTVTSGVHVATIALIGQYSAANFQASSNGQGGTDITFVAAPAPALAVLAGGH